MPEGNQTAEAGNAQLYGDLTDMVETLKRYQSEIIRIETEREEKIERIRNRSRSKLKNLKEKTEKVGRMILEFAEKNKEQLAPLGKKKTISLKDADAEIKWYVTPYAVQAKESEKDVAAELEKRDHKELLRYPPPELDKMAIARDKSSTFVQKFFSFIKKRVFKITTGYGDLTIVVDKKIYPDNF